MNKIQRVGTLNPMNAGVYRDFLPLDYVPNRKSTVLLGAEEDGYAAGVLWAEFTDHECEIMQLAVHPAFRRRGIGTELLEEFFSAFSRTDGLVPVHMHLIDDESNRNSISILFTGNCLLRGCGCSAMCI